MPTGLNVNGTTYQYPVVGDQLWGTAATNWAIAVTNGMLQKQGGNFTLTANVNFGANFGLLSAYFSTRTALSASAGLFRLAKTEAIGWRNNADSGNNLLSTDTSDQLLYNGTPLASAAGTVPVASGGTGLTSYTIGDMLWASAATTLSKLAIGSVGKVLNSSGTAPQWGFVTNAMVDVAAAIARSKLAVGTADHVVINSGTGAFSSEAQLAITRGGTGQASAGAAFNALSPVTTLGDLIYGSGANASSRLAGNITSTKKFLTQTGTGVVSAVPGWNTIVESDLPTRVGQNVVLNSDFGLWQRGTSTTIVNAATSYQADRFYAKNVLGTNGVLTYSQVAAVQAGSQFGASIKITTAPTAAQANGCEFYYVLENKDSLQFYNQTASLSAQIKALGNVTQVGLQFYYKTTEAKVDTSIGSEQTVTVNSSTFSLGTIIGQALGTSQTTSGVVGFRIRITGVSSGNTYDLNNGFVVEQVQMNLGATVAPWSRVNATQGLELQSCQRFYEKSYSQGTALATSTTTGASFASFNAGAGANVTAGNVCFAAEKRTVPTLSYWDCAGNASKYSTFSGGAFAQVNNVAAITANVNGTRSFFFEISTGAALSAAIQWAMDAEI